MTLPENPFEKDYKELLFLTATSCQALEVSLRSYISVAFDRIRVSVMHIPSIKFDYNKKDIKNDSLGTLAKKFKKLCSNTDLAERIDKIPEKRNKIMHIEFLGYFLLSGQQAPKGSNWKALIEEMRGTHNEVFECLQLVNKEAGKLLGVDVR